jgi:dihydroorotase
MEQKVTPKESTAYPKGYEITLPRVANFHTHLRDKRILEIVAKFTALQFGYAVTMTNTFVTNAKEALGYRLRVHDAVPKEHSDFVPLIPIMMTKATTVRTVREAHEAGFFLVKVIPANTSINSGNEGVTLMDLVGEKRDVVGEMQRLGMRLLLHSELLYDADGMIIPEKLREAASIPIISQLIEMFPDLLITIEHASTRAMIEFIKAAPVTVTGTLVPQHALVRYCEVRDADGNMLDPLLYFLPVAKDDDDVLAVIETMTSAHHKFGPGSDSAPHPLVPDKMELHRAGVCTEPALISLLCLIFETAGKLHMLDPFLRNGLRNYGLEPKGTITVRKEPWVVPEMIEDIPLFWAGKTLDWKLIGNYI